MGCRIRRRNLSAAVDKFVVDQVEFRRETLGGPLLFRGPEKVSRV
jgi:hypothetical protein